MFKKTIAASNINVIIFPNTRYIPPEVGVSEPLPMLITCCWKLDKKYSLSVFPSKWSKAILGAV